MRRILRLCVAGAVVLGTAGGASAAPEFVVSLWSPRCGVREGTPGRTATFTLRSRTGALRGICVVPLPTATTEGSCRFSDGVLAVPGDRVSVDHAGSTSTSAALSDVTITRIEPSADRVSGRVSPRKATAYVRASGERFTLAGRDAVAFSRTATAAADGSFAVDLTAAGRLRRNDLLEVGYRDGRFSVHRAARVPGLAVSPGTNMVTLAGDPGRGYLVGLRTAAGTLLGEAGAVVAGGDCDARAYFFDKALRPLAVAAGQKIGVAGAWGFTDTVESLTVTGEAETDEVRVKAAPGAVVEIRAVSADKSWTDETAYRKTDAGGDVSYKLTFGKNLRPGDEVFAEFQDGQGNRVSRRAVAR